MAETIIACPKCKTRLKVPGAKTAVRCPKCGTTIRVHDPAEGEDDPDVKRLLSKVKLVERVEEEDEDAPPAKVSKRRRDEDEDEDDRPARPKRRRSRDDDDDEDDDDRPARSRRRSRHDDDDDDEDYDRPRRKRRREQEGDGPWLLGVLAAGGCFLLTFGGGFLIKGTEGLAPGEDGPLGKLIGLGIAFLVSLVLIPLGIVSVKNRHAYGKWGIEVTGTMGVALGMVQAVLGGLIGGFSLYGLIFTLINGQ
jgi:hypothetical protein